MMIHISPRLSKSYSPFLHLLPQEPGWHLHLNPLPCAIHVFPEPHGLGLQTSLNADWTKINKSVSTTKMAASTRIFRDICLLLQQIYFRNFFFINEHLIFQLSLFCILLLPFLLVLLWWYCSCCSFTNPVFFLLSLPFLYPVMRILSMYSVQWWCILSHLAV